MLKSKSKSGKTYNGGGEMFGKEKKTLNSYQYTA